jgi:hypothetical protein
MPPPHSHKILKKEQKELLRRWIAEGAAYEPYWAHVAPTRPRVPIVQDRAKVNLGNATTDLANDSATGVNGGATNGLSNISTVIVGAGNNYLTAVGVSSGITFTATGNGNNILVGGSGNNLLTATGSGNNILIGGQGTAIINGGTGYNLLIGGDTAYDTVYADLESILGIWRTVHSARTYANAIASLTASSYAYALTAASVHGNASDTINAWAHALDWYFAALASEMTGENPGETISLC